MINNLIDILSKTDLQYMINILEEKSLYLKQIAKLNVVNENWKDVDTDRLDFIIKELKQIYANKTV